MSILQRLLIGVISAYRAVLSPMLGSNCRFHPTCSQYAAESIRVHGTLRGSWRAIGRVARCHPYHPGGYDPVEQIDPAH